MIKISLKKEEIKENNANSEDLAGSVILDGKKGQVNLDDFNLVKVIGRGAYGKVMLVQKKDDD